VEAAAAAAEDVAATVEVEVAMAVAMVEVLAEDTNLVVADTTAMAGKVAAGTKVVVPVVVPLDMAAETTAVAGTTTLTTKEATAEEAKAIRATAVAVAASRAIDFSLSSNNFLIKPTKSSAVMPFSA